MNTKIILLLLLFTFSQIKGSDQGIYLLTNENVAGNVEDVANQITNNIPNNFKVLKSYKIHTPDYLVKEDEAKCNFGAHLIILSSDDYTKMLTSYGTKYLVAGFIKIGIYQTEKGINVNISDPETINRIVFNDLYENDKEDIYAEVIGKTKTFKNELIDLLHKNVGGNKIQKAMEPIRSDEDLAESSKDMFMMVGPLTLFNDEDQFPQIHSIQNTNGFDGIKDLKKVFETNLNSFAPSEDDKEYRPFNNETDLKWEILSEIVSPKQDAILLGISRPRTEAVSFQISGSAREDDVNKCPGIDHLTAYPIEVLLIQEGDDLNVYTQNQMHRMDMYFWDAGMSAFMNHMSMPGILDESIKKALIGK